MMKKIVLVSVVALALCACRKAAPDSAKSVEGVWELTAVATKVSVGSVEVSVYMDFAAGGGFTLYQKIGEGRYTRFTGTYNLSGGEVLSGAYSDGKAWGPYGIAIGDGTMSLSAPGGIETDTYRKIDAVPDFVTGNLY